jgi:hypothetical protein
MDRALWRIMASMALVFMCSCAAKAHIYEDRQYCTGIKPAEGVVIALNTFRSHNKSIESEGEEKSIENCVSKAMMKTNQGPKIVSARDFRRTVFPNKKFEDSPRSSELLLYSLSDPNTQNRLTELGLRYVIIVSVTASESEAHSGHAFEKGLFVWGRDWTKSYSMTADVLDVKYSRVSGRVFASSSGIGVYGVFTGVLVGVGGFLPVPPIPFYYAQRTEAQVCPALGEDVMKFLIDRHDEMPAPKSEEDLLKRTQKPGQHDKDGQN